MICGCIPEINPERIKAEFNGETFSPQSYSRLDGLISAKKPFNSFERPNLLRRHKFKDDIKRGTQLLRSFDGSFSGLQNITRQLGNRLTSRIIRGNYANLTNKKTFYIQIHEGCSMKCSYCVIKKAIGRLRSKSPELILGNFKKGLQLGYNQFQLVGDNSGGYGLDIGTNLGELLNELSKLEGDFKLDLTDIHPTYISIMSESFFKLASQGRIARLYVAIQSGSLRILKLMNRSCDIDKVKDTLITMRNAASLNKNFRMGTSIIVGFPSETAEEIQQTIDFCKDVKFDWIWCHSFSARPETPAASMDKQVDPHEIFIRARLVKKELSAQSFVTTAEDSLGSRTCQG